MNGLTTIRPTDDVSRETKNRCPQWSMDMCKYICGEDESGRTAITPNMRERFLINKTYLNGTQDPGKYGIVPKYAKDSQESLRKNDPNRITEVFNPFPTYFQKTLGKMFPITFDISVNAIDERSGTLKDQKKWTKWVESKNAELSRTLNNAFGMPQSENAEDPISREELDVREAMGEFNLDYEIGMENLLKHTSDISSDDILKTSIIEQLVYSNFCGVHSFVDPQSGKVLNKSINIESLIVENSEYADFRDATYFGFYDYPTVNQLVKEGVDHDEIKQYSDSNGCVKVLRAYWLSNDYKFSQYRTPKYGARFRTELNYECIDRDYKTYENERPPKLRNSATVKTFKNEIKRLYKCSYIQDADKIWDFGEVTNTPFDYRKLIAINPITVYRAKGQCIIDRAKNILDLFAVSYNKMLKELSKDYGEILAIDKDSLANVMLGSQTMTPNELLKKAMTDKVLYYTNRSSGQVMAGSGIEASRAMPIQIMGKPSVEKLAASLSAFSLLYGQLDIAIGFDQITSGSGTPVSDQGKGVTMMAMSATNDTLRPLVESYYQTKRSYSRSSALLIQNLIVSGYNVYKDLISPSQYIAIKAAGKKSPVEMGFDFVQRPTDQEQQLLIQKAWEGTKGGKDSVATLTTSNVLYIIRALSEGASIKSIESYLLLKEGEAEARRVKAVNAQSEAQSKAAKEQKLLDDELADKAMQREITIIKAQGEEDRETKRLEITLKQ